MKKKKNSKINSVEKKIEEKCSYIKYKKGVVIPN